MKELFHGSISIFETIDLNCGKGYKDFGKGFYATAEKNHAEKIAIRNKKLQKKRRHFISNKLVADDPIVAYRYNLFFDEKIDDLSIKVFDKADVEWLKFILANRKCLKSAHNYDIVIGPTADTETTTIINDYFEELENSGYAENVCQKAIDELKPENLPK